MLSNLIPDGYTAAGYIAPQERLHGELRFQYRPMLPEEVDVLEEVVQKQDVRKAHAALRGVLVKHLVEWSESEAITADSIGRLAYRLWNRLYLIVSGRAASDPDPKATPDEKDEWLQNMLEAGGSTPGETQAERDAKNSDSG